MEPLMASLLPFAANFTPKGYMPCTGTLLSIAQYSALFSLLGTQYGGDGVRNFALPTIPAIPSGSAGAAVNVYIAVEGIYPPRAD